MKMDPHYHGGECYTTFTEQLLTFFVVSRSCVRIVLRRHIILFIKKMQAIYLMLYKRYKTAKIKKYKHEHVLAYTFNLSSVARINV